MPSLVRCLIASVMLLTTFSAAIMQSNRESLAALDAHFRKKFDGRYQPRHEYEFEFLTDHAVLEFGAYFGRVLINEFDAKWQISRPIMKSRVCIGRRKIDPFLIGWKVVFYEHRFMDSLNDVARLIGSKSVK